MAALAPRAACASNFDGTLSASDAEFKGGTLSGVSLLGNSDGTFNFANTVTYNGIGGTAFEINGDDGGTDSFGGSVSVAGTIMNDTGRSIAVQNVATGASISFSGNVTDTGDGLLVDSNSGGDIAFIGNLNMTIDTPGDTAVLLTNNTGTNIDFPGDVTIAASSTADGFVATGGGSITAPSTVNSVSTETGQAVKITNMTIANGDVRFGDVNRTAGAGTNAIQLENNDGTGSIVIGNTTDTVGDAGTIVGGTADAIRIVDSANVSITGIRVNNTSAVSGVHVEKSTTAAMTTNLSDLEINDGDIGIETKGGGTGALTMTVNDTNINRSTTQGMLFDNLDVGSVTVNNAIIDGNNENGTADGVLINGSNGSITFDIASRIRKFGGNDFEVSGGSGTISFAGGIENASSVNPGDTSGHSVNIHNVTGGTVTLTSAATVNDENEGILVTNNTGGTFNISSTNTLSTGANDAVTVTNNTGATTSLSASHHQHDGYRTWSGGHRRWHAQCTWSDEYNHHHHRRRSRH